jgi:hypothetical protein
VGDEGDQAIVVFARFVEKRIKTHPVQKHENVAEKDRQGMAHKQVFEALPF